MTGYKKTAVVTGAASGIGLAVCRVLSHAGWRVYGADIATNRGIVDDNLAIVDCTQNVQFGNFVQSIEERHGENCISALINCMGVHDNYETIKGYRQDIALDIVNANLKGYLVPTFKLLDSIKHNRGSIVNMGSVAGLEAGGGGIAYTMAKHAIHGLTKQLALELAQDGVNVNVVAPACVRTGMTEKDFQEPYVYRIVEEKIPMGRYADPIEIATMVEFLVSEKARYVTGAVINVDGGWTAAH